MKVLLFFFLILSVSISSAQIPGDTYLKAMATRLTNAKIYALALADKMPREKYTFRPIEGERNFGEQLIHIASNLDWLTQTYLLKGGERKQFHNIKSGDKDAVLGILRAAFDTAIAAIEKTDPATLTESLSFFAGPMYRFQIIELIADHQTHHRGQLVVYARLNFIKPPDYTGW